MNSESEFSTNYDYLFKCLFVGDSGIGKSSIVMRYADDTFLPTYISTIGVDFKIATLNLDNKKIKIQIWDTAGQERFRTITNSYYRGAHIIFICYDITDRTTFKNLNTWLYEISRFASPTVKIVICGTKLDLIDKRDVPYEEAKEFCNTKNIPYFEVSAKTDINVDKIFTDSIQDSLNKDLTDVRNVHKSNITLTHSTITNNKYCCY